MTELLSIAEKMDQLTGSELKAIIAIYTEGRYLGSRDMMNLTGMSRKTCLHVMESEHVKEAISLVQKEDSDNRKEQINQIRKMLIRLEKNAK